MPRDYSLSADLLIVPAKKAQACDDATRRAPKDAPRSPGSLMSDSGLQLLQEQDHDQGSL
jgi:hypothetical protein